MIDLHKGVESVTTMDHAEFEGQRSHLRKDIAMSDWITDRRPTAEDAHDLGYVWVTTEHGIVLRQLWNQIGDRPWMPIARPEPYVNTKRFRVAIASGMIVVCDSTNGQEVAGFIPTYEAAERIAAIYEEVMP